MFAETSWRRLMKSLSFLARSLLEMKHGFLIRSRDEEAKSPMEVFRITKTKEGQNVQIQDQSNAHHFFDQKGLVHHEFVPEGQTVNQHFYTEDRV